MGGLVLNEVMKWRPGLVGLLAYKEKQQRAHAPQGHMRKAGHTRTQREGKLGRGLPRGPDSALISDLRTVRNRCLPRQPPAYHALFQQLKLTPPAWAWKSYMGSRVENGRLKTAPQQAWCRQEARAFAPSVWVPSQPDTQTG